MTAKELKKKERKEKIKRFIKEYWLYIVMGFAFGYILEGKNTKIKELEGQLEKAKEGRLSLDEYSDLEKDLADLMVNIQDSIESDAKYSWFERSYKNEILKKRKLLTVTIKEKGW